MNSGTLRYTIRPYDTIWMLAQIFNTTVDSIMELNPGIEPRNLLIGQVVTIAPGYQYYPSYPSEPMMPGEDGMMDMRESDLMSYVQLLWSQYVKWTRFVVEAILSNLPGLQAYTDRYLRVPEDFGDLITSYYGEEAGHEMEDLFTANENTIMEMVRASMNGDVDAVSEAEQRLFDNADQLAAYLGRTNPYWSEDDWDAMLFEHLNLVKSEVENMVAGNYEEAVNISDTTELQALEMADMMAQGITTQFPG